MNELLCRIDGRAAKVVVIGIGYVGLPLVVEFAKAGTDPKPEDALKYVYA